MTKMLVIVPTRARPENAQRLMQTWRDLDTQAHLMFCVDDDDSRLNDYLALGADVRVGPRLRLGPTLNECARLNANDYEILGFMGDDHVPRTQNWDTTITNVLQEMGTGIAYGNDLLQRAALPTAVFMTSDIVRALNYFCPPELLHMYLDNAWLEWGRHADCITYLDDVVIEHMHPALGKAPQDQSYAESGSLTSDDHVLYNKYVVEQLQNDVLKIRQLRGTA
jgi:hypothetical protein